MVVTMEEVDQLTELRRSVVVEVFACQVSPYQVFACQVSPYQVLACHISPRLLTSTTYHENYLIYLSHRSCIAHTYGP